MNAFTNWFRTRRTLASVVVIALMAGVPLTVAVLHQGFPSLMSISPRETSG